MDVVTEHFTETSSTSISLAYQIKQPDIEIILVLGAAQHSPIVPGFADCWLT